MAKQLIYRVIKNILPVKKKPIEKKLNCLPKRSQSKRIIKVSVQSNSRSIPVLCKMYSKHTRRHSNSHSHSIYYYALLKTVFCQNMQIGQFGVCIGARANPESDIRNFGTNGRRYIRKGYLAGSYKKIF